MKELTIIVPTHNRHEKLARLLTYLSRYTLSVIVLDSSPCILDQSVSSNIRYVHNPSLKFADKVVRGCELAQTDYVCLCADDDFVLVGKLPDLIQSAPIGVKCIIGSIVIFNEVFDGKFRLQSSIVTQGTYRENSIIAFFESYSQVLWGIYCKDALMRVFGAIMKMKFNNDNFIEMYMAYSLIRQGGIHRVKDYFTIREATPKNHWGKRHKNLGQAISDQPQDVLSDLSNIAIEVGDASFVAPFTAYLECQICKFSFWQRLERKFLRAANRILRIDRRHDKDHGSFKDLDGIARLLKENSFVSGG